MAKKKSFVTGPALYEDPALSFISRGELQPQEEPAGPLGVPEGYRPAYVERRSRRVQLVLPPSLYGRVKQASQGEGLSLNEFCCRALERAFSAPLPPEVWEGLEAQMEEVGPDV